MCDVEDFTKRAKEDQDLQDDGQAHAGVETLVHDFQALQERLVIRASVERICPLADHQRDEGHGLGVRMSLSLFEEYVNRQGDG